MDEAVKADRILVIDGGKRVMLGTPRKCSGYGKIKNLGLDVPQVTEIMHELNIAGYRFPKDILTVEEALQQLLGELAHE